MKRILIMTALSVFALSAVAQDKNPFIPEHPLKGLNFPELSLSVPVNLTYCRMLRVDGFLHRLNLRGQPAKHFRYVVNLLFHRYKDTKFI